MRVQKVEEGGGRGEKGHMSKYGKRIKRFICFNKPKRKKNKMGKNIIIRMKSENWKG